MIEVEYYYKTKSGEWKQGYMYFTNPEKAVRFMRKCTYSKTLHYSGSFTCDYPEDTEYIVRHFR